MRWPWSKKGKLDTKLPDHIENKMLEKTDILTKLIIKINEDDDLDPKQKIHAIRKLGGISRKDMYVLVEQNGPKLHESILRIIDDKTWWN